MVSEPLPLLALLFAFCLQLGGVVGLYRYVSKDAAERGIPNAQILGAACAVLLAPLVYYGAARRRHGERESPPTADERRALFVGIAGMGAWLPAAFLPPPDPVSTAVYALGCLLVTAPLAYLVSFRSGWSRAKRLVG
ncbi:hypothetical protein SAMN04487950_2406 [Halogranum rubrum]|uniref:Uncharacterized protein n=1 Tax=Halogranum rubrum TaxID=553466 RepID=A0A1I4EVH1_9EURY|nr:hypothetical protein [Halogranum rubrum]SFL09299.1 hypothetical protein SAMN04487950_2406 [Halogranum rubrum]